MGKTGIGTSGSPAEMQSVAKSYRGKPKFSLISKGIGVFLGGSHSKTSACNVGDPGSILRLGRSPGEGNGYTLQYSCLEYPMDRRAWWATVHWITKNQTRLSALACTAQYN